MRNSRSFFRIVLRSVIIGSFLLTANGFGGWRHRQRPCRQVRSVPCRTESDAAMRGTCDDKYCPDEIIGVVSSPSGCAYKVFLGVFCNDNTTAIYNGSCDQTAGLHCTSEDCDDCIAVINPIPISVESESPDAREGNATPQFSDAALLIHGLNTLPVKFVPSENYSAEPERVELTVGTKKKPIQLYWLARKKSNEQHKKPQFGIGFESAAKNLVGPLVKPTCVIKIGECGRLMVVAHGHQQRLFLVILANPRTDPAAR